jgi:phospholipid/cholesterol/gamma-HCH transport system substrate-binding protein
MNRTFWRDFLTGATAIAGLLGVIGAFMLFGELRWLTERSYSFRLQLDNAAGLGETGPVLLNGVKVGSIAKVEPDPRDGSLLTLQVQTDIKIPRESVVSVNRGFVGDTSLEFGTTKLTDAQLGDVVQPGEILRGGSPTTLLGTIESLVREPIAKLSKTAESVDALAAEYKVLGERLNDLMAPRTLADVQAGSPPNVRSTIQRLDSAMASAQVWLDDAKLRSRVEGVLANAEALTTDAKSLLDTWTKAGASVETTAADARQQVAQLRTDLQASTQELVTKASGALAQVQQAGTELATLVESVNQGQGTLGQLATNPDLYRSLDAAAAKLERTLEEARLLVEKFRTEGVKLKL